jgi:ABC-type Fe3+-hydroxamate transport system substrate-binding protein
MRPFTQIRRFVAIILLLFTLQVLSACNGPFSSQQPPISTTADTGGTPIDGVGGGGQLAGNPCPAAKTVKNTDGTSVVYKSIEQQVVKGNALVLSLPGGTSQVVGLFQSQSDLDGYITQHNTAHSPVYKQTMYPGPSILVLQQVNQDAYDLIILEGGSKGGDPSYDCRVVSNNQVDSVLQQLPGAHTELQGVQPLKISDYKFTLPSDQHFA